MTRKTEIECENCFAEMMSKTDTFLEEQKDTHKKSLDVLEQKHNDYLDKKDKREARTSFIMISALIIFAGAIGYMFDKQTKMNEEIANKADKIELKKYLPTSDAISINQVRDAYYRDIFILNPRATADSTNYNLVLKTIFGANSRSATTNTNN